MLTQHATSTHVAGMIEVKAVNRTVQITVRTDGTAAEQVNDFVTWLQVEAIARRSNLSPSAAWQFSEEIKAVWWDRNKQRFGELTPRATGLMASHGRQLKVNTCFGHHLKVSNF